MWDPSGLLPPGLLSAGDAELCEDLTAAIQYLKGAYKQQEDQLSTPLDSNRTSGSGLIPKEGRFQLDGRKTFVNLEGADVLEQTDQRGCGCPIPGETQGQVGWETGRPDLEVGNAAHGRGLEQDDLQSPFQPKPFHEIL